MMDEEVKSKKAEEERKKVLLQIAKRDPQKRFDARFQQALKSKPEKYTVNREAIAQLPAPQPPPTARSALSADQPWVWSRH